MDFKQIRIPYEGREKYPAKSGGQGSKAGAIISNYSINGGGGSSTSPYMPTTGSGSDNRGGNYSSFFAYLTKTSGNYSALDMAQGEVFDNIGIVGYRQNEQTQTFVGDIGYSAATGVYDIQGIPDSGLSVMVLNNGTTATTIRLGFSSTIDDSGTLDIPIAINISDNAIDPYHYSWHDYSTRCVLMNMRFSWTINRAAASTYVLDLSNQTAQVNCDADGNLYPNSIATLQCTATTYYNGVPATGVTYSAHTQSFYGATGYSINTNTGVMTFNTAGTKFYFNTAYPSLPIDIVAFKDDVAIATKTMNINRNYPGSQGEPATMWWIETDKNIITYNPKTAQYSTTAVTGNVYKQVGNGLPERDNDYTIWQWYNDNEAGRSSSSGTFTAPIVAGISAVTFALQTENAHEYFEVEDVPVIPEGTEGPQGAVGPQGPSGNNGESNWYLTLDNDNASINADENGNIYSTSIRPSCRCRLYYGSTLQTGNTKSFDISIKEGGVAITPSDYDITLTQTSSGAEITLGSNFHFSGMSLPIVVTGFKNGSAKDSKTFNITKSIAGADGEGIDVQWSVDGLHWHSTYRSGDIYMRQYVNGEWSNAIRAVGEDGEGMYTSTIFKTSITKPQTPTSTTPVPEHEAHSGYSATFVSSTGQNWTKKDNVFTHTRAASDVLKITASLPNGKADFRIRVYDGLVYYVQSGTTAPNDWNMASMKTDSYALYQYSGNSTANTSFYFKGEGNVSVELLTPESYIDTDWQDSPIEATASTIEYIASGDWEKFGDVFSAADTTNLTSVEKIDFTTTEANQLLTFIGEGKAEKGYDYMVLTKPDITDVQLSALTETQGRYMSMSANTIIGRYDGIFSFTQAVNIPKAGNHTIYVLYKTDGSSNWGGCKFKIATPSPMWFSMAKVEDGTVGEWSVPQKIGYEPGKPAVSYWLEVDHTTSVMDTDNVITPSVITAKVMKQVGGFAAMPEPNAQMKYTKLTRGSLEETPASAYTSGITLTAADFTTYQKVKLYAYVDSIERDSEEVDLLKDGKEGIQGRSGYAIRGPYNYYDYVLQSTARLWCDGQPNSMYPASEKYLDIIYKDGVYYYCNNTYVGTAEDGFQAGPYWTQGGNYDFVAANLILASGASINFLTNNELYLRDSNNQVTGGAAGGSGITFWAGSQTPGNAPFQVNASGEVTATKGLIGGWEYDEGGLSWVYDDHWENTAHAIMNGLGIDFNINGAGYNTTFEAGVDGIKFSSDQGKDVEFDFDGDFILDGGGTFYCRDLISGNQVIHPDSATTTIWHYPVNIEDLEVNENVTMRSGTTMAVGSILPSNFNLAIMTTGTSSATYFSIKEEVDFKTGQPHKYLYFNNDMKLISMAYWNEYQGVGSWIWDAYYVQVETSGENKGKWMSKRGENIPRKWTGIYGPNFTDKKGDTIYFSV